MADDTIRDWHPPPLGAMSAAKTVVRKHVVLMTPSHAHRQSVGIPATPPSDRPPRTADSARQ